MACLAGSTGASVSSAPSRLVLEQAPARLPQAHEMERREAEISRAIGMEMLRQTAASTLAALL
jgi:hypothetical protein